MGVSGKTHLRVVQNPPCLRVILGRPSDDGNEGLRKSAMGPRKTNHAFAKFCVSTVCAETNTGVK